MEKVLLAIAAVSAFILSACAKTAQSPVSQEQAASQDEALKNALNVYSQKRDQSVDLTNGPCLGIIANDWVLDIAHNPRQDIDDKSENQCPDFKEGRAHHFVELDPDGKLIKIV